ncbi:DUF6766 family protein [Streptomyces sp. CC0208]|uniref:DUF6766 family protein n=2 Tax=Streptomyces TaxID=1883 RepID=UPI001F097201|nr:DUF6766 family protein [Streptomyces sp. CC0208]
MTTRTRTTTIACPARATRNPIPKARPRPLSRRKPRVRMHKAGTETDQDQKVGTYAHRNSPRWAAAGGLRQRLYSHSLGLVMGAIFVFSWLAQSIGGVAAYNEEQLRQPQAPMSWSSYTGSADFWSRTLQNWQSELLAVASMAILSVHLRQRGSPESKLVGAAHSSTGVEGWAAPVPAPFPGP